MVHGYICSKLPKEFRKVFGELYNCFLSTLYFHALVMLLISEVYSENFESHPDHWDGNIYNLEYCLELAILHFIISWSFHFFVPQGDGIWLLQSKERERWRNVENDEWREVAENAACLASSGTWLIFSIKFCHLRYCSIFPGSSWHMFCSFRWMHCWSLTVQHKTSTTGLSTVVSCCSSEI